MDGSQIEGIAAVVVMDATPSSARVRMRPATLADAGMLLTWRNDAVTRRMSITQEPVTHADHMRWYTAALQDPERLIWIAEESGSPVGMCRFDLDVSGAGRAEISINLAPEQRGRRLGGEVIDAAITSLVSEHPEITTLRATIRPQNSVSLRLFESRGFHLVASDDVSLAYERPSVV